MRRILTAALLITFLVSSVEAEQPSSDRRYQPDRSVVTVMRNTDQENVLIFMDNLPWGFSNIQSILDSLGATYTEAPRSEMATIDMNQFDVIIMASEQPLEFYQEYQAQSERFIEFLEAGGVLEFHCATLELNFWPQLRLPGGATHQVEEAHYNYVVNENHPIVAGLPDTLHGSFASHEHFLDLPIGTDIILVDEVSLPTTIEYSIGMGTVIATGMAWEFNYAFGYTSGGCLPNAIAYSLSLASSSAVTISLTPYNPPIVIPADGGVFAYLIEVANNVQETVSTDLWIDVTLPDSSTYGPILGPINIDLPGEQVISRERYQVVPATAPAGIYSYNAYTGVYPDTIWDSDTFTLEKTAGESSDFQLSSGWFNGREDFQGEKSGSILESPSEFDNIVVHPNPFNPTTTITFDLPVASQVNLDIFDTNGRRVGINPALTRKYLPGIHRMTFDGSGLKSGVYIYRLTSGDFINTGKMVLLK